MVPVVVAVLIGAVGVVLLARGGDGTGSRRGPQSTEHAGSRQRSEQMSAQTEELAHELNNVFQSISSWVLLMRLSEELSDESQQSLQQIMAACERGGKLLARLGS